MRLFVREAFQKRRSVYFLYLIACCYLFLLLSFARPDTFYLGDGGLKFMMIRQISAGEDFRYISHTQPQWVENIWAQGFFPIRPIFVYPEANEHFFVFAPFFQFVSAFPYREFGYGGLYIIPAISLMLFWAWFLWLGKKLNFSNQQLSASFFLLAFCSPLTLYGAIFWEHTMAILMLFSGVVMIALPPQRPWHTAMLGLISGLAVWLRPEALLLNMLYSAALLYLYYRKTAPPPWLFISGVVVGIAGYLLFNKLEYGFYFGMHGRQVLGDEGFLQKYKRIRYNIKFLSGLLLQFFPFVLLMLPVFYTWYRSRRTLQHATVAMLFVSAAFWFLSPFIFPSPGGKQWGPRFFLMLIPICLLVIATAFRQWEQTARTQYKNALLVVALLITAYAFVFNTFIGATSLYKDDAYRVYPTLDLVKRDQGSIVVVNSHFITMELSVTFREKHFFLIDDTAALDKLIPLLKNKGEDHFIYINYGEIPNGLTDLFASYHTGLSRKGDYWVASVALNK